MIVASLSSMMWDWIVEFVIFFRDSGNFPGISFTSLERKMRREVANSNERRRMQNINSGFEDLKAIVCSEDDGKISKVSLILPLLIYVWWILIV